MQAITSAFDVRIQVNIGYGLEFKGKRRSFSLPVLPASDFLDVRSIIQAGEICEFIHYAANRILIVEKNISLPPEGAPVILPHFVHLKSISAFDIDQDVEGDGGVRRGLLRNSRDHKITLFLPVGHG